MRQKEIKEILEILNENPQLEIVSYGLSPKPNGFCFEYDDSYYGEVRQETLDRLECLLREIECDDDLTKQLKSEVF